ncbi:MFS transporter [Brockia lithotrophica]|nr:MFS transporter [Brockia lithotrophica]
MPPSWTALAPGVHVHPDHATLLSLLDRAPFRRAHLIAWILASGGTFLDGFSVFMLGMAIPLVRQDLALTATDVGLLGSALLAGAIVGASVGGRLADHVGRKPVLIGTMFVAGFAAAAAAAARDAAGLVAALVVLGAGIGMDFPASSSYIAECMPRRDRGRVMVATIAAQAVGMVVASRVASTVFSHTADLGAWRILFFAAAAVGGAFGLARTLLGESPRWLMGVGRNREAVRAIARFVRDGSEGKEALEALAARLADTPVRASRLPSGNRPPGFLALFHRAYLRRTVLSTLPWFFMDVATYGVGLFTAVLLSSLHLGQGTRSLSARLEVLARGSGDLDVFLLLGFLVGMWAVPRFGRIRMQLAGFLGMAFGAGLLLWATAFPPESPVHFALVVAGFVVFNLAMNAGPNSTTYILPAELFPTRLRATGSGFAAAAAKGGATLGVFLIPLVQNAFGLRAVLGLLLAASLLGFGSTWAFRVDDRVRTLEEHQAADLP